MDMTMPNSLLAKLTTMLEMIKFSHTVFAFPFALMGVVLASLESGSAPTFGQVFWVCLAMVGARTGAMRPKRGCWCLVLSPCCWSLHGCSTRFA
jgi:hypothetical protein